MLVSIPEEVRITSIEPSLAEICKDVSLELDGMEVSKELCITHKFSNRSPSNPNGIPPQSPGLGGTTYPGNNVQEAFSTPKVLRQSSAIWAQPRWGCFEAGPRTQGRPAAVAEGQPWAGGRNPVGIKGNEAVPQIANLWVMHSSLEAKVGSSV
mgnify:CR=1 FL=1